MASTPDTVSDLSRRTLLRRAAAAGLLASPAAGLLSACATGSSDKPATGGDKSSDNPLGVPKDSAVEVIVFNGGFGDKYPATDQQLVQEKHAGVKVDLKFTQKIKTEMQPRFSATPPDLINNAGADMMGNDVLANQGALLDLTPLLDAPSWDDPAKKVRDTLAAGTVDSGTLNGKPYALNYVYGVFGIWYNAALFTSKGWNPPKTFDDFFTLAEQIKAAGIAPWVHAGKYPYYMGWPLMDWIQKLGGPEQGRAIDNLEDGAWKTDEVKQVITRIQEMVSKGYVLPGSEGLSHLQSQQAWLDGKAAFIPVGTWLESEMSSPPDPKDDREPKGGRKIPPGFEMTMLPVWDVTGGDKMPYGAARTYAAESWVVPAKAKNPQGGMEFLRAMLSKAGAGKFSELTKAPTVLQGGADAVTGSTALASINNVIKGVGSNQIIVRINDWYADFYNGHQGPIGELMAGRSGVDKFMDDMQRLADKIKKDSKVKKQSR
ncbi:N-acetylglucosamine/diacetylchitobiose ABC transporter substrate-binding protein [Rhizomonospora bruguierae]|uniref:N-acetylglucosamine/diacetylchitobiose ABC transporter substrate-binding protein n=1 Tax=Rhizomonospora bruguierae TaxID=1581705 RepID=UPI001BCB0068|nr:N-acetylglucosamine/diacetylchitobiose ABC transporter substrate-binding protein [Micromonospora sp. NBRC 107566]